MKFDLKFFFRYPKYVCCLMIKKLQDIFITPIIVWVSIIREEVELRKRFPDEYERNVERKLRRQEIIELAEEINGRNESTIVFNNFMDSVFKQNLAIIAFQSYKDNGVTDEEMYEEAKKHFEEEKQKLSWMMSRMYWKGIEIDEELTTMIKDVTIDQFQDLNEAISFAQRRIERLGELNPQSEE